MSDTLSTERHVQAAKSLNPVPLLLTPTVVLAQLACIWLLVQTDPSSTAPIAVSQNSNPTIAPQLLTVVIGESLLLVGLYRVWDRIPQWLRTAIKYGYMAALVASLWLLSYVLYGAQLVLLGSISIPLLYALYRFDLYWVVHNGIAMVASVLIAMLGAIALSPTLAVSIMALAILWDVVAVWKSDLMQGVVKISANIGIPNYVVLPTALRIDMDEVTDYVTGHRDEKPVGVAGVLGAGDIVLPALLVGSIVVASGFNLAGSTGLVVSATIFGTVVGAVVLGTTLRKTESGLPALLWLNTGAIAGFVISSGVMG